MHLKPSLASVLAALAALAMAAAPARAEYNIDPMAHWRAQIEDARRKTIPAPPKGVRELHWNEIGRASCRERVCMLV